MSDIFFRRLVWVRLLHADRSHCCMTYCKYMYGILKLFAPSLKFVLLPWHAGIVNSTNAWSAKSLGTWSKPVNASRQTSWWVVYAPWPSFGNLGHRHTSALWWCSYFAWPDVTSIKLSWSVSIVPNIRSMPLTFPVLRWADLTDPYLKQNAEVAYVR